jgi:hypothetical protein
MRPVGDATTIDESLELRQRAFAAYAAAGQCDRAARAGVWISHQHLVAGGRWEECRVEVAEMMERRNEATGGTLDVPGEYLIAAGAVPPS